MTEQTQAPVLKIDNLQLVFPVYGGEVSALNQVSLSVNAGEIVGVVGESGSGKSVTAMMAMRLLPPDGFTVTGGALHMLGTDVVHASEEQMRTLRGARVAMIFQEPMNALNPTRKIGRQMCEVICLHQKLSKAQAWQKAIGLLDDMQIADAEQVMSRYPFELSGGMRQRVLIAMGDLDIADSLPMDQLAALKKEDKVAVEEFPSLRVTYLYLNNAKAPLNQVDLRRAISSAVDYQGMVKGILGGNAKQMRGPIPEGMWGFDPGAKQYTLDLTQAKADLVKVKDKPQTLDFLYSDNDPNWESIALAVQASLGQAGINVKLEKLANATMRDRIGQGDYDISIGNWSPDFADPYMFMNYWFESDKKGLPGNRSFYSNPDVDALWLKRWALNSRRLRV